MEVGADAAAGAAGLARRRTTGSARHTGVHVMDEHDTALESAEIADDDLGDGTKSRGTNWIDLDQEP